MKQHLGQQPCRSGNNKVKFILAAVMLVGLAGSILAGGRPNPPGSPGDNIALNKTYTLSLLPDYCYCSDTGDAIQLTDGAYTSGYFWCQESTVGWDSPNSNPIIIIDLKQVYPIQGISYNTAGGTANVAWPTAINISVSNDGINYYPAGELAGISNTEHGDAPVYGSYQTHRYYTENGLAAHGRYVKIEVVQSPFVFVDEIEIYRGADTLLGQNIAAGCSYTMNPSPSYPLCSNSDPGDYTQLTDGIYTTTSFWETISTVGWVSNNINSKVEINIDLGQIQPIEGLSFNSAAGNACVEWPLAINIFVSDNGTDYYDAGELISLSVEHGLHSLTGHQVWSYWTDRLATCGRYVKLIISSPACFLFCDEIEIYQGNAGMLSSPSRGAVITDMNACRKKNQILAGRARRIMFDINTVQALADADAELSQAARDEIEALLTISRSEVIELPAPDPATFEAVLPLNNCHARIFQALSKLWQDQGLNGLIAWGGSSQWDPLGHTETPSGNIPELSVKMMQNEYRSTSFNLSNATDNDLTVSVTFANLPDAPTPSYITVHAAEWTDTRSGVPVASALPPVEAVNNQYSIYIPSGMTRQVWITFHPVQTDAKAYNGAIVANGGSAGSVSIPLEFELSYLRLPDKPGLSLGGFDYTSGETHGVTSTNKYAFVNSMKEHFVDTAWGSRYVMQRPVDINSTVIHDWVGLPWGTEASYMVFLSCIGNETFGGFQPGTPGFNSAVADWINYYAGKWDDEGIDISQVKVHILDEPSSDLQADTVTAWANAIHAAQPDIKIWNNPAFTDPITTNVENMLDAVDIISPDMYFFLKNTNGYSDIYRDLAADGKTLHFYSCRGPASALDPYSYYRMQAWLCMREGATGMHYWQFGGANGWNEYALLDTLFYGTFFLDADTVTTSKAMEAIREGVEDYEYLAMLKSLIAGLEAGGNPPDLDNARDLRDDAAVDVMNESNATNRLWSTTKDRNFADSKRLAILSELESLANISSGCSYSFNINPNYELCRDADDNIQLTDGQYTTGTLWYKKSTVGWGWPSVPVEITIDLGSVQPIEAVSYSSAGGSAQVAWPTALTVGVSDDGSSFSPVVDLVAEDPPPPYGTYRSHAFDAYGLNTSGRYVRFTVYQSPYVFVDEIRIIRGNN